MFFTEHPDAFFNKWIEQQRDGDKQHYAADGTLEENQEIAKDRRRFVSQSWPKTKAMTKGIDGISNFFIKYPISAKHTSTMFWKRLLLMAKAPIIQSVTMQGRRIFSGILEICTNSLMSREPWRSMKRLIKMSPPIIA